MGRPYESAQKPDTGKVETRAPKANSGAQTGLIRGEVPATIADTLAPREWFQAGYVDRLLGVIADPKAMFARKKLPAFMQDMRDGSLNVGSLTNLFGGAVMAPNSGGLFQVGVGPGAIVAYVNSWCGMELKTLKSWIDQPTCPIKKFEMNSGTGTRTVFAVQAESLSHFAGDMKGRRLESRPSNSPFKKV